MLYMAELQLFTFPVSQFIVTYKIRTYDITKEPELGIDRLLHFKTAFAVKQSVLQAVTL